MPPVVDLDVYGMMGGEATGPPFLPHEEEGGGEVAPVFIGEIHGFRISHSFIEPIYVPIYGLEKTTCLLLPIVLGDRVCRGTHPHPPMIWPVWQMLLIRRRSPEAQLATSTSSAMR